ncbi:PREDICTED: cerebellar degeneration-related protein 2-like isoform X2 [Eufriesea mexicana]|uniref:cerebellar degeneration-related protein 2-like isoform X2 n=1 Tax=Eufriesea mexicana TaxID=516756 RepID=UPI00083C06D1|nr:PREDICTED: cerebellar degeneration-related protein 2-like isoform X2 [Eufriesea mexicana]
MNMLDHGNVRYFTDEETDHNMLEDLQLAAELGKTLLERNKELENIIKAHQSTVEEQAQEIEYMKKQTAALREVNDSRLKVYEQLEVSIQDLERANHRLIIENSSDKKLIKSQCLTIENLEARCEDLQKKIDEAYSSKQTVSQSTNTAQTQTVLWKASVTQGGSIQQNAALSGQKSFQETSVDSDVRQLSTVMTNDEEITELLRQLQETRSQRAREQKKIDDLGQQLTTLLQENNALEEQLNVWRSKAQDVKNLQEEINTLEEVRRGQLCGRCLRGMESKTHDELAVMLNQEEYDDINMAETLVTDNQCNTESIVQESNKKYEVPNDLNNPYRVLVEKYQALLEVQRRSANRRKDSVPTPMSLQEELVMSGEFNSFQTPTSETEVQQEPSKPVSGNATRAKTEICGKKAFSATPTDFSEAETSSSGFSDETSNKASQTEGRPGSFLCSIADGEDCKFSIYDDNSPFESRFRKTPEYRYLFSEIFSVLKRAAEAKAEGEKLPLLNDSTSTTTSQAQSSIFLQDVPSETTDDNQSIVSSVFSSTVSEPLYRQIPVSSNGINEPQQNNEVTHTHVRTGKNVIRNESLSINVRKKSSKKNSNRKLTYDDRPTTPDVMPIANPRFVPPKSNSGKKKKFRPIRNGDQNGSLSNGYNCVNKTKELPNFEKPLNNINSNTYTYNSHDQHNNSFEYKNYKPSTASEEVARLKRLEMSYAEVLRLPNKSKRINNHKCM